jgi:CubicO group peptidase (beta-lactamase class C family)
MREEREIIGYIVSQRRVSSSLQEEGDGGIMTSTGGMMERSPAILQREEMRGRDGNQRREGRDSRHYSLS